MRLFLRLLALVPLLLGAACRPDTSDQIVLRISNWGGAGDDGEFDRLVASFYRQFEQDNPGVRLRIELNPGEGYAQKMLLNFVAGAEPDIMVVDASSAAVFINNGVFENLTPYIEADSDFDIDDFYPNVVDIGRRDDAIYTIPSDFTPMVMYYNRRLFDEAGVPYPQPGWTFDQFLQTAQALTDHERGRYGFLVTNWMPAWVMWLWNNGGEALSPDGNRAGGYFDSPQSVEAITFLRDLVTKHRVAPALSQAAAQGIDPFANGQVAMKVSGQWEMVSFRASQTIDWRDLGVVELPSNVGRSHTVMYEAGYGISLRSKHKDLAWKFVKMWSGYELQKTYSQSGIAISARKDVSRELAQDPVERQFLDIVSTARPPAGSWIEGYGVVERQGGSAMDTILNDPKADVRAVLNRAATRIDREFAKR
jgi:multiple sugar transport system substrate-binding protein